MNPEHIQIIPVWDDKSKEIWRWTARYCPKDDGEFLVAIAESPSESWTRLLAIYHGDK